jgi:hypothetical protein
MDLMRLRFTDTTPGQIAACLHQFRRLGYVFTETSRSYTGPHVDIVILFGVGTDANKFRNDGRIKDIFTRFSSSQTGAITQS